MPRESSKKTKWRLVLGTLLVLGMTALSFYWQQTVEVVTIDGRAVTVIDGDSFKDGTAEYRLSGIDAPEYRQTCTDQENKTWACGRAARAGLEALLRQGDFGCELHARDQYGRSIVTCQHGEQDLGAALVDQGHALSSDHFGTLVYGAEEARAEKAKRGIWQGKFATPANWRAAHPR